MTATQVDAVFSALADPTRRSVLETLSSGATVTASGLARTLPISRQAVSKHLASLRDAKLVSSERVGRETVYALRPEPLEDAASLDRSRRRGLGPPSGGPAPLARNARPAETLTGAAPVRT